jgi:urease accessory protein
LPSTCSRLAFEARAGRTVLADAHAELPLLVQRPLHGPRGEAVVTLLTPSGALFDGDAMHLDVRCGPDADVTLTTAAATKLNRCPSDEIQFDCQVDVAPGATFRYLPHEIIPFGGARYRQHLSVELHGDARAWLLDVVSAGQSGAAFTYARLSLQTTLSHDGSVFARERMQMTPRTARQLCGATHYAGLFALGPNWTRARVLELNRRLACAAPLAGASQLPVDGIVLKALGDAAAPLRAALLRAVDCPRWLDALLPP